ncbi:hypothetical protein FDECE_18250 [Fusarium decemcellulare]|nr:hypothetical protein FDECE_18250 [Fusarium decemcellulare]
MLAMPISSSNEAEPSGAPGVSSGGFAFIIHDSTAQAGLKLISHIGSPPQAPPVFSSISQALEPKVTLFQGFPNPSSILATGSSNNFTLHGQPGTIKHSSLSGKYAVESSLGTFKWADDSLSLAGDDEHLLLKDTSGRKLARLGKASSKERFAKGGMKLEIYVAGDGYLTELMVLTSILIAPMAGTSSKESAEGVKAAFEVIGILAGMN